MIDKEKHDDNRPILERIVIRGWEAKIPSLQLIPTSVQTYLQMYHQKEVRTITLKSINANRKMNI